MTTKAAWPIIRAGDAMRGGSVWVMIAGDRHRYTYIWNPPSLRDLKQRGKYAYKINVFPKHPQGPSVALDKDNTVS